MAGFVWFYFFSTKTHHTDWVSFGVHRCLLLILQLHIWEKQKCLQIKLIRFFRLWGHELPCAHLQPALCTWTCSLWKEETFSLFFIFLYSSLFVFFFSILFLSLSCLVASCLLTRKLSGIERIQVATVLGHQTFYHKILKGEFGSRRVLAKSGSGISFQVDKPGKLVLAWSCQGSCGHYYHRKLSLFSQGMWDICGRGRWCLQSRLLKSGCPGAWLGVSWWHLTRTAEVQGPAQPCCHLSVPLGQGKLSQNCFNSWALPPSPAALGACTLCIALALDCCSSPKVPGRKSSKPKTPVGVFKGFWVWDNDLQLIRWQGTRKDTAEPKPCESSPSLHLGRMCVGWRWGSKEDDLECAVKRNAKQTKTPLPSVHFDCSLKPYGLCFNYWTAKICFQSVFFVS